MFETKGAPVAEGLIAAAQSIGETRALTTAVTSFLRPNSKWHRYLRAQDRGDNRLWEIAVLFHLRDGFRSGDVWLDHSRRYGDLKQVLVPMASAQTSSRMAVPIDPHAWLGDRKARISDGLKRLARAARDGAIPHGSIEDGTLRIDRLIADVPENAEELVLDLYRRMPPVRITDILLEVDAAVGFSDAFPHLRTGAPCSDQVGLLNVLLAEGLNLGLRKMAEASNTHDYWQLSRLARWHVESEALDQALAMVVAAQGKLPMSRFWGMGTTASSDGQFFRSARQGEAMNMINAKYGNEPGLKAYTHVNDQFAPFASQTIPATVSEAPYILDGLLMNEAGRQRTIRRYCWVYRPSIRNQRHARLSPCSVHPRPALETAVCVQSGDNAQGFTRPGRGQNPRSNDGRPALPDRRAEFAHSNHHLLEHRTSRPRHRRSAK